MSAPVLFTSFRLITPCNWQLISGLSYQGKNPWLSWNWNGGSATRIGFCWNLFDSMHFDGNEKTRCQTSQMVRQCNVFAISKIDLTPFYHHLILYLLSGRQDTCGLTDSGFDFLKANLINHHAVLYMTWNLNMNLLKATNLWPQNNRFLS